MYIIPVIIRVVAARGIVAEYWQSIFALRGVVLTKLRSDCHHWSTCGQIQSWIFRYVVADDLGFGDLGKTFVRFSVVRHSSSFAVYTHHEVG